MYSIFTTNKEYALTYSEFTLPKNKPYIDLPVITNDSLIKEVVITENNQIIIVMKSAMHYSLLTIIYSWMDNDTELNKLKNYYHIELLIYLINNLNTINTYNDINEIRLIYYELINTFIINKLFRTIGL